MSVWTRLDPKGRERIAPDLSALKFLKGSSRDMMALMKAPQCCCKARSDAQLLSLSSVCMAVLPKCLLPMSTVCCWKFECMLRL